MIVGDGESCRIELEGCAEIDPSASGNRGYAVL